jgi:NADPH:quinone reductase-like Zn-dependent oxidoreductase
MWDLLQAGRVVPVIDRRYRLSEVREAIGIFRGSTLEVMW